MTTTAPVTTTTPSAPGSGAATGPARWGWAPSGWRQFLPPPRRLEVSDGELAVLIVCTLVTTIGLAGDIARHLLNPGDLEGDFLSGWHLVLYGGVASVGAWIAWGAFRRGPSFVGSVPTTTIGFLTLTFGGAFDAVWHEVFGTEKAVEALVSPPHLVVFAGLAFLLTSPLILLWHRPVHRLGLVASIAAVVSVVSALLVASLFTGFLSPMAGGLSLQAGYVEPLVGESMAEYDQVRGLGVVVWSGALIMAGFTPLLARFGVTRGLVALGVAILGLPPVILSGQSSLPVLVGFVCAGAVLEAAVALWGRPTLGRVAAPAAAALFAGTLWAVTFWGLEAEGRMLWSPSLRWGSVMIAAMMAAATAALVTLPMGRNPANGHGAAVPGPGTAPAPTSVPASAPSGATISSSEERP